MTSVAFNCEYFMCCAYVLSHVWLFATPWTVNCSGSSLHRDSPGKNTRGGYYVLLQGFFPIQGSNPGVQHCRWILYHLSHQGSPRILEWVVYPFSRGFSQPRNWTCIENGIYTIWEACQSQCYINSMWWCCYSYYYQLSVSWLPT